MKPSLLAALCALLLFLPTALGRLSAEEGGETFSPFGGTEAPDQEHKEEEPTDDSLTFRPCWLLKREEAARRIKEALCQPLKPSGLQFVEEPLNNVLDVIEEEYDIPIVIDESALEELGVSSETEVTFNVRNVTLRKALNLLMGSPGLEDLMFVVDDEVLLITTEDRANATLLTRVYPVKDLLQRKDHSGFFSGSEALEFTDLREVVVSCVAHDTWAENGTGDGTIALAFPGVLVVSQTSWVHEEIEILLADIRAAAPEDHAGRENPF